MEHLVSALQTEAEHFFGLQTNSAAFVRSLEDKLRTTTSCALKFTRKQPIPAQVCSSDVDTIFRSMSHKATATHIFLCLFVGESVGILRGRRPGGPGNTQRLRVRHARRQKVIQGLRDAAVAIQPADRQTHLTQGMRQHSFLRYNVLLTCAESDKHSKCVQLVFFLFPPCCPT